MKQSGKTQHHVLIVGGGFGGIKAARELSKHTNIQVTLLSDRPDFRYYPTLYHTATGGPQRQSSIALTKLVPGNVKVVQGTAETLDRKKKAITTREGQTYAYDTLVLALGSITSFFGLKGVEARAYGIKSVTDALAFKQHLHEQLAKDGKPDDHYVVIGGGATGIELAGELPHYLEKLMRKHGISGAHPKVDIIDTAPTLLPRASKPAQQAVERRLKHLGITLHLGQMVKDQTDDAVITDKETIPTHTAVWTAGMANNPFFAANEFKLDERKKVVVDEHLQAEPDVYVIGDNANTAYAGLAQTAIHDAMFVSGNIARTLTGQVPEKYHAQKPPTVFPAGPYWAAVDWGWLQLSGVLGWFMRQAADILGFHDYESWPQAIAQWSTEFATEEDCPACKSNRTTSQAAAR